MDQLKPPDTFSFEGNISERWKTWRKGFEFFMSATEADSKSEKVKTSILLTCIGARGREIYETFEFETGEEKLQLDPVLQQFENYCNPRTNTTMTRHKFFTYHQVEGQSFNTFVTELKMLASLCEFDALKESLIKDMIICGVSDASLRERMLREPKIDLKRAVELGQAAEETRVHLKQLGDMEERSVNTVAGRRRGRETGNYNRFNAEGRSNGDTSQSQTNKGKYDSKPKYIKNCRFCAGSHGRGSCPAYGKHCAKCNGKNHFAKCCWYQKKVDMVDKKSERGGSSSDEDFFLNSIEVVNPMASVCAVHEGITNSQWSINLLTNKKKVCYKIDTGAQVNVIPKTLLEKIGGEATLKDTDLRLTAYNNTEIEVCGECVLDIEHKSQIYKTLFIVVDANTQPIIGLKSTEHLNLVKRVEYVRTKTFSVNRESFFDTYSDCFGEVGVLRTKYKIELKPDVRPTIVPPRKIPFALKPRVKEELDHMEKLGIIQKVEHPTEWVNALVTVEKPNGKLRICLDPRPLNKAIKRQHFRLPTTEEILSEMHGARIFSKIDASSGYWQIPIEEESTDLLTFGTHFGRYKFLRMPFGIHSASEIFQREVGKVISDLEGVSHLQDDIIIYAENKELHDERVKAVLQRVRASGMKLNKAKCVFGVPEISFLGHIISSEGIRADPKKVEAITSMPVPTSKVELQRFLGMINYLGKFLPNLAEETAPLRILLKKENEFLIQQPQLDAINRLKSLVVDAPVRRFYDPNAPIRLRTDSSLEGLGAMVEQQFDGHWYPIAYGSRSLAPSEKNYAPIEREALSVLFGCTHFHDFLYGHSFVVKNDHQPLRTIFAKSILDCPPRIQRFFLVLQKYDFKVEYEPGRYMAVSDALSRASLGNKTPEITPSDVSYYVHSIISNLPISQQRLLQIQEATERDETLQKVKYHVLNGWPLKQKVDRDVSPYYKYRSEIVFNNNLLLRGQRIIIPSSLKKEIMILIHQGHLGVESCKRRSRQSVFWPFISHDITNRVENCPDCLKYRNRQQKETLINHELPDSPWIKVATDMFTIYGKNYIVVVDYYSKYFEVALLSQPADSPAVVSAMKRIFSRHGLPKLVYSDNGPQYTAIEFTNFARDWDFSHDSSSPFFPQSNGLVERTIQTIKRTMKKAHESNQDILLALLVLNTTPGEDGMSHAEKMFKRQLRTTLPSILVKDILNTDPELRHSRMKESYNKRARDLPELSSGTVVRIRTDKDKDWSKQGKIVSKRSEPRSYNVMNDKGNLIRRNRRHLIPTNESFHRTSNYEYRADDNGCSNREHITHDNPDLTYPARAEPSTSTYQSQLFDNRDCERSNEQNNSNTLPGVDSNLQPDENDGDNTMSHSPAAARTRSGRQSRIPNRYKDYVMK